MTVDEHFTASSEDTRRPTTDFSTFSARERSRSPGKSGGEGRAHALTQKLFAPSSLFFSGLMGMAGFLLFITLIVKMVYIPRLMTPHGEENALAGVVGSIHVPPSETEAKAALTKAAPPPQTPLDKAALALEMARHALSNGQWEEAASHSIKSYDFLKPLRDQKDTQLPQIEMFDVLAQAWEKMNKQTDAIAAAERSLKMTKAYYGERHREVAYRSERLSSLYEQVGQQAMALISKEQALDIALEDGGINKNVLAMNYNNLGESYRLRHDYTRAEASFRRSIRLIEEAQGADAPELAVPLNNLGRNAFESGNLSEAESYLRRSLDIFIEKEGVKSVAAQKVMDNLKELLEKQGRRREADILIRRYFL